MPFYPQVAHHGAVTGVAGSCHELHADGANSYLVDCGLFQGVDSSNRGKTGQGCLEINIPLGSVRALIATHVHIDHVGRIPYLLVAGFEGPILCREPSAKLLPIVLKGDQKHVERYIKLVEQRIIALPYNTWFSLRDANDLVCRIRLQRAEHILGSAYVEFDLAYPKTGVKRQVVFFGELGVPHAPMLPAPKPPYGADILVIESTYGDRQHENRRTRRQRLERVIERALADNDTVLIPAISIGRTQELLYELEEIIHTKLNRASDPIRANSLTQKAVTRKGEPNWPELPIILDSSLASGFTAAYRDLQPFWNQEALKRVQSGRRPLGFE